VHRSELTRPGDTSSPIPGDSSQLGRVATIRHVAFVTPGNYAEEDPETGLEEALHLFEKGEDLGFDSAWVRSRHLERGISSAATFLAAASQRTRRIRLGTAVIQLGYENPFRLAEDLATADLLSNRRLEVGVSAGPPAYGPLLGDRLFEGDPAAMDFSYNRALRLRDNLSAAISLARISSYLRPPATSGLACNRTLRHWPKGSGMAGVRCAQPNGRDGTASTF
jgi:hypothetical protein